VKPLVLCLGSDIVSDDGFGPAVAAVLRSDPDLLGRCDVEAAALAGFALLDLLRGRPRALVVDAAQGLGPSPGDLRQFAADSLTPTHNLIGSHQISLPVALQLGRRLGYGMPVRVDILACEAADLATLGESLSPPVAAAIPEAVRLVMAWVEDREPIPESRLAADPSW